MADALRMQSDLLQRAQRKVWDSAAFLEEFCSHITAPSCDIAGSVTHFIAALEYISDEIAVGVVDADVGARADVVVKGLAESLAQHMTFYRKLASHEQWNSDYHFSRAVLESSSMIQNLGVGEFVIIPVRIPSGPIILLFEGVDDRMCDVVVFNPSPFTPMHRKTVLTESALDVASNRDVATAPLCAGNAKIVQNIAMRLSSVRRSRAAAEAFWLLALGKLSPSDEMFYQHLLTWMTEKDFEGQTAEHLLEAIPATPSKAPQGSGGLWKPLVHTLRYMLHSRAHLNRGEVKHVRLFARKYFIARMETELGSVKKITLTQKKLMEAALGTLALAAARAASSCSTAVLDKTRADVERITQLIGNLPIKGESTTDSDQAPLDVTSGWDRAQQADVHPLFDMFRRLESVEGFVGVREEQAKATPINFFRFREQVSTIDEVLVAMADVVQLLVRVSAHSAAKAVKNAHFLIVAAVAHMVIEVLPAPMGVLTKLKTGRRTLWDTPIAYAQQVHLLAKLEEVALFFHWAYRSADAHRDQDAVHMVVTAMLAAIADNVLRTPAFDLPSVVTTHLNGTHPQQGSSGGFSVSSADLMRQTEIGTFTYPEALIARAAVLDYFDELVRHHPSQHIILKLEENRKAQGKEVAFSKLLKQIAVAESFAPLSHPAALEYATNEESEQTSFLCRFYPEFKHWRNLIGIFKATQTSSSGCHQNSDCVGDLPPAPQYAQQQDFLIYQLANDPNVEPRYASDSDPKGYVSSTADGRMTEDDLLHMQSLPSFGILGQRDVELLLSYLTTPYLRIPLVLRFFATEDRVSSLMDESLCTMLHGVLFEPGRFLPVSHANECPIEVPSEQLHLIATPNGLLLNELQNSPQGVIEPLLKLLRLVKEMDAGTVFNESVTRVIFVLTRIVAHVEGYLYTVLHHPARLEVHREERSFVVPPEEYAYLLSSHKEVRSVIGQELLPMLDAWIEELNDAIDKNQLNNLDPSTASSMLCGLHQHALLLLRNVEPDAYDADFVSRLLSSFSFLTTRFVWGHHVHFNEHEVYLILHKHRRGIAEWLYTRSGEEVGFVMNSVIRVATGSGKRVDEEALNYIWGFVAGRECSGRFTRADPDTLNRKGARDGKEDLLDDLKKTLPGLKLDRICVTTPTILSGVHEVEVSVHSGCLTFKATFLKAIPQQIAADIDVHELFEQQLRKTRVNPEAMQCAIVEEATNRTWIQLVGLEHDIQFWKTHDARVPIPSDSMRFYPDDCELTERWIAPIFELYRRAFFQRSFFQPPILILLPEEKLTDDACVAMLTAVCSATGEKLKEIFVFRDVEAVHIFDVVSHGRRFYRQHVFCSDPSPSFIELSDMGGGGDGTADKGHGSATSAVILRRRTHPKNLSRSVETYIPVRFLRALVPDALLAGHTFWQDEDDNIRGYPKDRKATHLLWLHWKELRYGPMGSNGVGVQVLRFAVAAAAPRASEQAVLRSQRIDLVNTCDEEISLGRVARSDSMSASEEQGTGLVDAGMYRQSSVVHVAKPDSATIEDHNLLLLNLLYAREGTPLYSLAKVLVRLEPLAHVLAWTAKTDYDTLSGGPATLDLIYLPRLKLSFRAKLSPDGASYVVYSLDHAHLHITNDRPGPVMEMLRGIPHCLLMADANDALTLLVPRFAVCRINPRSPFSVEVMVQRYSKAEWYDNTDTRYYLYPVHISQMFLFTPSYASAVYLLMLRFLNRNYSETFRLVASVGTDEDIPYDVRMNLEAVMHIQDNHPDAIACMARMTLYVGNCPSCKLPWDVGTLVAHHIRLQSRTSVSCLMPPEEELRLVQAAWLSERKVDIMRDTIQKNLALLDHRRGRNYKAVNEVSRLASIAMRETLGMRLQEHKVSAVFERAQSSPLDAYHRCLIDNRRQLLLCEQELLRPGATETFKILHCEVPKLPEDPRPHLYKDYDPTSITPEAERWLNDQGKVVTCSPNHDFYYCNVTKREYPCKCPYACREVCGGNKDGCPCLSCLRFNDQRRNQIRLMPQLQCKNPTRPVPFMEVTATARNLYQHLQGRLQRQAKLTEPCNYHSEAISLRHQTLGFYFLYELTTGSKACKIGRRQIGRELTQLLLPLYADGTEVASALSHMIQYISKLDKEHMALLPQFSKKVKSVDVLEIQEALANMIAEDAVKGTPYPLPHPLAAMPKYTRQEDRVNNGVRTVRFQPRRRTRDASIPLANTRILPAPLNCENSEQRLELPKVVHLQLRGEEALTLRMSEDQLEDLTGWPLRPIVASATTAIDDGLAKSQPLLRHCRRSDLQLSNIPTELPFDLSLHPDAHMTVAREMLERLTHEMDAFATRSNAALLPKLCGLESEAVVRRVLKRALGIEAPPPRTGNGSSGDAASGVATVEALRTGLDGLKEALLAMRQEDVRYVAYANAAVIRTANFYSHESREGLLLWLRSVANREPNLKLEYLLSALCSTTCNSEWLQLNPFLTPHVCEAMQQTMVLSVLRANRAGHINRVLEVLRDLDAFLHRAKALAHHTNASSHLDAFVASVSQKADTLASLLAVKKCYFGTPPAAAPHPPQGASVLVKTYDPRHLLFEFTWNLVMRKRQHELIGDMYSSIERGESVVKQMIMGAGKTTVVSPVLGLMLANGRRLVVQVVPPALLDFTRAVLRTTFSSILQKQIFTFLCDRSSVVDTDVTAKFEEAMHSRGIVLTTPSSVKSLFLKCVESCRRVVQPGIGADNRLHLLKETRDHLRVLTMWKDAVLVMDEVDMLLHPLKSELNFPIGAKAELDFQPLRWKLPIHLLDLIFYYHTHRLSTHLRESPEAAPILEQFHRAVGRGLRLNALQEMPHLILLSQAFYEQELKPILIEWLLLFIKGQHLVGLTDDETRQYVLRRPTKDKESELLARVEALDPFHIKVLNLSYEWMSSYLPHVLQKIDRVTFGIMTQAEYYLNSGTGQSHSRLVTAIPFVGKDMPSPSSEFAHPDIVIGLTVLAYRYEGLRETDFHLIMQEIFSAVEREVGRFNQRRTTILYNKWVAAAGGSLLTTYDYQAARTKFNDDLVLGMQPSESLSVFNEREGGVVRGMELRYASEDSVAVAPELRQVLPLKLMKQANELEMKKLYKLFRRTPEVLHWYLTEHIFPEHMRHQEVKLSASGQELGGEMLFQRRIGFSGTPSSLLPVELGQCGYEVGTDGQLIHTLTSPDIMNHTVVPPGWNVRGLLDVVATTTPPFHALIDTGALITGMSNLQVAEYLLKVGLPHAEGVVYLDEEDRKMILVRATGRSLLLAECGIPKVKRFAFYDQIHTTGMDIDHTPNAQAVQTLGKDMTFRDFSQGAYRMRGIGQGQTVHLLIIPEVHDLIQNAMRLSVRGFQGQIESATPAQVLVGVTVWLLVNSVRSEHTQHNQLRVQSCSNVWRKAAYQSIVTQLDVYEEVLASQSLDDQKHTDSVRLLQSSLGVFEEALDYSVPAHVPQPRLFSEMLEQHVAGHDAFVQGGGRDVIAAIIDSARREDELDAPVIDVEMVQEQEEEREREEQKEEEQEVEIEKFVDHDYSREHESSIPWRFDTLSSLAGGLHQFYPLKNFHLFKRNPLMFPDSIHLSRNYYSTVWSGYRRMKNVVVTMEWVPSRSLVTNRTTPSLDYGDAVQGEGAAGALKRTLTMLMEHQGHNSGATADAATLKAFLQTALHFAPPGTSQEWDVVLRSIESQMTDTATLDDAMMDVLRSNALRHEEDGRFTVAVTLAEAETLRRILHHHKARGTSLIDGSDTEFSLHVVPSGNALLDRSPKFPEAATPYQRMKNFQCLRYFDGDLQYTDAEVGLLLRALHSNTQGARKLFFHQTIACRRRARQRWDRAPISIVFLLQSAFVLLHQRTVGLCMCKDITDRHQLLLPDAFIAFNASGSGVLSAEEVWGAMRFCRLMDLTAEDVLDFVDIADASREGTVQYPEFLYILSGSREATDEDGDEQQAKNLPSVPPYGGVDLTSARNERQRRLRMEEEESSQALADEERRVMEEIEQENIRVEMDVLMTFPNPKLESKSITFDFASESQVAQLTSSAKGVIARQPAEKSPSGQSSCMLTSDSALRCSIKGLMKILREEEYDQKHNALAEYTLTSEFCIPKAASYETRRKDTSVLSVVEMDLAQWQLPYCCYISLSSWSPIETTIAGQLKSEQEAADQADATQNAPVSSSEEKGRLAMIFKTAIPSRENFIGYLTAEATQYVVMSTAKRQSVVIHDSTYEYGLLDDDRFPKGWICCRHGNDTFVHPLMAKLTLLTDRLTLTATTGELPGPPYARIQDTSADPERAARWGNWRQYYDDEAESDEEEEEEEAEEADDADDLPGGEKGQPRVYGDVEDLMLAIRKLRTLEKGDRVRRHPKYWQHEDEDGGEGTVGKVMSVSFDEVTVKWPNQNQTVCHWGKAGVFELLKVPKDALGAQADRKPDNDERHREYVESEEKKGTKMVRPPCEGCRERFAVTEMLACNECPKLVHLCEMCFRDGHHEVHDFTELRVFTKEFRQQNKEDGESDEEGAAEAEEEEADMGDLFDFFGDTPAAPADPSPSAKSKSTEERKKEEKPKDPRVVTATVVDAVPHTADGAFNVGRWVRSAVKLLPSVQMHHIGIVTAVTNDTHITVQFLSDVLGDSKTYCKNLSKASLIPVATYADTTYGKSIVEAPRAVATVLDAQFSPGVWLLHQAAKQRSKFAVGSAVVAESDEESPTFFAIVGAVLPNKKYMVFPVLGQRRYVLGERRLEQSFHKGTSVRYKRSVSYPVYGWPAQQVTHIAQRYTMEYNVAAHTLKSNRAVLSLEPAAGRLSPRNDAAGEDLEEASEAKWVIYRRGGGPVAAAEPTAAASWDLLPNSCRIIIDRAHSEGKRLVRFTYAKKLYRVDFPSNRLVTEGSDGDVVQGTLCRYPPLEWSRPPRLLALDDGAWHLVTVMVTRNSVTALVDGAYVPLDIEGHFEERCAAQRRRTDKSLEQMRRKNHRKDKRAKKRSASDDEEEDWGFGLFDDDDEQDAKKNAKGKKVTSHIAPIASDGSDDDDGADDAEGGTEDVVDPPHQGPEIAALHAVSLPKPVVFLSAEAGSTSQYRLYTFPQRFVTSCTLSWCPVDAAVAVEHHKTVLLHTSWVCSECQHVNPRHYLSCDECAVPRRVQSANRMLDAKPHRRFRYALLRSTEAKQLRTKLGNKLRSMFQMQLDEITNAIAAAASGATDDREDLADAL